MSEKPVIHLTDEEVTIRMPRPRFSDFCMRDFCITSEQSDCGQSAIIPWSADRIAEYEGRFVRWQRYGRHVVTVAAACGRTVRGGLVDSACTRLNVPLREPADRSAAILNGQVLL